MRFIYLFFLLQPLVQTPTLDKAFIHFQIKHMGVLTVEGTLDEADGEFEETENGWKIVGEIDVSSISTGNSSRDQTILTEQYLNATMFPTIPFTAKIVRGDSLFLSVDATIRGLTLSFTSLLKSTEHGLISEPIVIDRQLIGLDFGAMDTLIGDEITLVIHSRIKESDL